MRTPIEINRNIETVSDISDILTNIVNNAYSKNEKVKTLINSSMGTGKTYAANRVADLTFQYNLTHILVVPTISLAMQVGNNYGMKVVTESTKHDERFEKVVTTPDSLPKVVKKLEELKSNEKYVLWIDEAHQIVADSTYRKAYTELYKYENKEECITVFHMTATDHNIINHFEYDYVLDLYSKNREIEKLEIMLVDNLDLKTKASILQSQQKEGEKVIYYNNNKTQNYKIGEILGNKNVYIEDLGEDVHDHICADNRKVSLSSKEINERSTIPENVKYLGLTSVANAGVEIYLKEKAKIVIFCDLATFNHINELQLSGRIRTLVSKVVFVIQKSDKNPTFTKYNSFRIEKLESYNNDFDEYFKLFEMCKQSNSSIKQDIVNGLSKKDKQRVSSAIDYNKELDIVELNELKLEALIWNEYAALLLQNPLIYLNVLKNEKTLSFLQSEILDFNNISDEIEEKVKEINEANKATKNALKDEVKEILEELKEIDYKAILRLLNGEVEGFEDDLLSKWSKVKDIHEGKITTCKNIIRLKYNNLSEMVEALLNCKPKELNNIQDKAATKYYYELYENKKPLTKVKGQIEYYTIRDFFLNKDGSVNTNKRLSLDLQELLFNNLKEAKIFNKNAKFDKKLSKVILDKVELVFNLKDKNTKISSIKKY